MHAWASSVMKQLTNVSHSRLSLTIVLVCTVHVYKHVRRCSCTACFFRFPFRFLGHINSIGVAFEAPTLATGYGSYIAQVLHAKCATVQEGKSVHMLATPTSKQPSSGVTGHNPLLTLIYMYLFFFSPPPPPPPSLPPVTPPPHSPSCGRPTRKTAP